MQPLNATEPHQTLSKPTRPAEYARMIGVNPSTVSRWIKAGRITINDKGYLDPEVADRQRQNTESPLPHHQARKAQFDQQRSAPAAPDAPTERMSSEEIGAALRYETYRLQKAKAEKAAMEADQLAGALVEMSAATVVMSGLGHTLRQLLESLPERHAIELASHNGDAAAIHHALEGIVHALLNEISAGITRQSAALGAP